LASPASAAAQFSTNPLSIYENLFGSINVYPNPTTGELKIESGMLSVKNVEIFDVIGKKVFMFQVFSETVLNISHLQGGFYFVRISTEAGEVMRKVLKE
jgi:hypothetical protein